MDISSLRPFDNNQDQRITKAELKSALGKAADDHKLDPREAAKLGLDPGDASQINKALKASAQGRANTTVFLLDGTDAVRLQSMGGAIFNKTESDALPEYRGITAKVRLPELSFDASRYYKGNAQTPLYKVGPLDRPSVYLGGISNPGESKSRIMDVGLCWDRVYSAQGLETFTDKAPKGQLHGCDGNDPAHRFFADKQGRSYQLDGQKYYLLRAKDTAASYSPDRQLIVDASGKVYEGKPAEALLKRLSTLKPVIQPLVLDGNHTLKATGSEATELIKTLRPNFAFRPYWRTTHEGDNKWNNPPLGKQNLYFYPGESLQMTVKEHGKAEDNIELRIERKQGESFSTRFSQDGFGQGKPQAFKYVHSIDQFREVKGQRLSTENMSKINTATSLNGVSWQPFLIDSEGKHVKMDDKNSMGVGASDTSATVSQRRKIFSQDAQGQHINQTK